MSKLKNDAWEHIRGVNDEEIRNFISSEQDRLGIILQGFTITWLSTETEYQLELFSNGDGVAVEGHPWPHGIGFQLGSIPIFKDGQDCLVEIQQAGREFYFLWRKEIKSLKRDLGKS